MPSKPGDGPENVSPGMRAPAADTEQAPRPDIGAELDQLTGDGLPLPRPRARSVSSHVERSLETYQFFIVTMITISIFGASTFAVIAGEMTDPASIWAPEPPPFTLATVRSLLAAAWLCFSLVIGTAGYSSSVLALMRHRAGGQLDSTWLRRWEPLGIVASAILHILIVTAFLLLSLTLVAYVGALGWVIVGFACAALVFAVGLVGLQCR